jgi:hypothetical protein
METSAKAGHNVKSLFKKIAMSLPGMESAAGTPSATEAIAQSEYKSILTTTQPGLFPLELSLLTSFQTDFFHRDRRFGFSRDCSRSGSVPVLIVHSNIHILRAIFGVSVRDICPPFYFPRRSAILRRMSAHSLQLLVIYPFHCVTAN